jgi:hypothetical protein
MKKYGVDESPTHKEASDDSSLCPKCSKPVKTHGKVLLCPDHGSKPFESDDNQG